MLPALAGVASAVFAGGAYVLLRFLRDREHPETIVFVFSLVTVIGLLPVVLPTFDAPDGLQWIWLLGLGVSAAAGQFSLTAAYRHAPAGRVSLLGYTTIVFSAVMGWIIWSEVPDALSVAGGFMILAGAVVAFAHRGPIRVPATPDRDAEYREDRW